MRSMLTLRQAPSAADRALGAGLRPSLPPPCLSRFHRTAAVAGRDANLPGRSRSQQAVEADRSPAGPARVRRLLGPQVGRPAQERREDHGSEGGLGLPALAARSNRRRRPLDEMVRKIVAARGSTWTNPPSSFHRTNRDPTTAAETVAQVFLGIRLQCAGATTIRSTT